MTCNNNSLLEAMYARHGNTLHTLSKVARLLRARETSYALQQAAADADRRAYEHSERGQCEAFERAVAEDPTLPVMLGIAAQVDADMFGGALHPCCTARHNEPHLDTCRLMQPSRESNCTSSCVDGNPYSHADHLADASDDGRPVPGFGSHLIAEESATVYQTPPAPEPLVAGPDVEELTELYAALASDVFDEHVEAMSNVILLKAQARVGLESECSVPPPGWRCTRGYHRYGPCAAVRSNH